MKKLIVAMVALSFWAPLSFADGEIGIFESILESSEPFFETYTALEQAIEGSAFELHAVHTVRVPDNKHKARVYVLTSPVFAEAAAAESPRTISAQILRIAVFTSGDRQSTFVNMANPVAHAMIFYADSRNYDVLVAAAGEVADEMRELVKTIPGRPVSVQLEPKRDEEHYNKYKGDGPARMMAKFRTWRKSQLTIFEDSADNFDTVVEDVIELINASNDTNDVSDPTAWELVSDIRLRDDVVHLGLSNPFLEDRMIAINSRFRSEGKSNLSPYPGVDHVAALPTEVLIVREGGDTHVVHYGQMWRMQLYFWDSGYRAFTANMGVPGDIVESIEETVLE